jgi:hypothetical protein
MSKSYLVESNRELANFVRSHCANCLVETSTNRVHVGSTEFIFCSQDCALEAMKRRGNRHVSK